MSRKPRARRRALAPDALLNSVFVSQFVNIVMLDGKKSVAEGILYSAIGKLGEKSDKTGIEVFEAAIRQVVPVMEVKSRRVGGSTYQVPTEVSRERGISVAMKWIVRNARKRKGQPMADKLAQELWDAFNEVGASIKNRDESHKAAEANKPFAHLKW